LGAASFGARIVAPQALERNAGRPQLSANGPFRGCLEDEDEMSGDTQFHLATVRAEILAGLPKGGFPGPDVLATPVFLAGRLAVG
jgi:hypothetical protein